MNFPIYQNIGKVSIKLIPKKIGQNKYILNLYKVLQYINKYKNYNDKLSCIKNKIIKSNIISKLIPDMKINIHKNMNIIPIIKNCKVKIKYFDNNGLSTLKLFKNDKPTICKSISKKTKLSDLSHSRLSLDNIMYINSNKEIKEISIEGKILGGSGYNSSLQYIKYNIAEWILNNHNRSFNKLENLVQSFINISNMNCIEWIRQEFCYVSKYNISSGIVHDICNKLEKNVNK
jgi:hypothetical protein